MSAHKKKSTSKTPSFRDALMQQMQLQPAHSQSISTTSLLSMLLELIECHHSNQEVLAIIQSSSDEQIRGVLQKLSEAQLQKLLSIILKCGQQSNLGLEQQIACLTWIKVILREYREKLSLDEVRKWVEGEAGSSQRLLRILGEMELLE